MATRHEADFLKKQANAWKKGPSTFLSVTMNVKYIPPCSNTVYLRMLVAVKGKEGRYLGLYASIGSFWGI